MPLVERKGITLVGLTVTNLDAAGSAGQLALPLAKDEDEPSRTAAGDG